MTNGHDILTRLDTINAKLDALTIRLNPYLTAGSILSAVLQARFGLGTQEELAAALEKEQQAHGEAESVIAQLKAELLSLKKKNIELEKKLDKSERPKETSPTTDNDSSEG